MRCHLFSRSDDSIEQLPSGWATAQVTFKRKGTDLWEDRVEIIHLKSQTRYLHEPMKVTALKCAELLLGIPLYFVAYMLFHCLRVPLVPLATICTTIKNGKTLGTKGCVKNIFCEIPKSLAKNMWKIVSAPFYALAMEFAAAYGVLNPVQGRALIGKIEGRVHHPKTRRDDIFRYHTDEYNLLKAFIDKDFPHTFYLAHCMQPFGKLTDEHLKPNSTIYLQPGKGRSQTNLLPVHS